MKFSYAVAAVLLAGSASASTIEGLFRRQSIQDILSMIPPACQTPCQPLVSLSTRCANDANPERCACTSSAVENMDTCITCVVREVTNSAGGGSAIDPATLQSAIDQGKKAFADGCKQAGFDISAGGNSGSNTSTGGASSPTNTAPSSATNTAGTTGNSANQGSGAIRVEFAASAVLAVVAGAALLV